MESTETQRHRDTETQAARIAALTANIPVDLDDAIDGDVSL